MTYVSLDFVVQEFYKLVDIKSDKIVAEIKENISKGILIIKIKHDIFDDIPLFYSDISIAGYKFSKYVFADVVSKIENIKYTTINLITIFSVNDTPVNFNMFV